MTYGIHTFESGLADETTLDNTTIVTGMTSGFTVTRSVAGTGTVKADTANPHRGTLAIRCDAPATGDVARVNIAWSGNQGGVEPYVRIANYPTVDATNNPNGEQVLLTFRNSTGAAGSVNITSAGRARIYDAAGQALWLSTSAIPLNQYVRYSLGVATGSAASSPYNGVLRFQYFAGADLETSNPTETSGPSYSFGETPTAANTGTAILSELRVGKVQSAGVWQGVTIDDLQVETANANLIGAVTGTVPVNGWTVANQVKVDASSTTSTPTSQTLVYVSGPVPTSITGPASGVFTVTLPSPMSTAMVLRLTSTNGAGNDQDLITINPSGGSTTNIVRDSLYWTGSALA